VPALHPISRALLALAGIIALAAAFAGTPLIARGGASAVPLVAARAADPSFAPAGAATVPNRDPFAGGDDELRATPAARASLPPIPSIPSALAALPPNAGAAGVEFAAPGPRLAAVATGSHPYALVTDGASIRIVSVGEPLAGSVVTAIDGAGLRLADGTRLGLDREAGDRSP
jgi:hypothetical protein